MIERHGVRVEREPGDTLTAYFGFPTAHEDDALRAVRAVADAQMAILALNDHPSGIDSILYRSQAGIEVGDILVASPGPRCAMPLRGRSYGRRLDCSRRRRTITSSSAQQRNGCFAGQ